MRTLLSASEVYIPRDWTVCGTFLCCYNVCARFIFGVEDTPGSIQTTQSESLRSTDTLHILSLFHSSYWIETVTAPIFNRAGTAKVGGPSTVKLAWVSTVLLVCTQHSSNEAKPMLAQLCV